jgi:hypothetical protein
MDGTNYRNGSKISRINTTFNKMEQCQDAIGWRHFIRGRIPIQWGQVINDHRVLYNHHMLTAEQWGAKLLNINWQHILEIWNIRNLTQHGADKQEAEQKQRMKMLQELKFIQSQNTDISKNLTSLIKQEKYN